MHVKRNSLVYFLITLGALILICIIPLFQGLYQYNRKTVTVDAEGLKYVSIKQLNINQTFWVEGHISNLKVYFIAPSGALYRDSIVKFTVSQGDWSSEETTYATMLPANGFYTLKNKFSGLETGSASISVTAPSLPEGTDIFCVASQTLISGLPAATMNDSSLSAPIRIQYDVFKINNYFWYETVLLTILLLICILLAYFLTYQRSLMEKYNLGYIFCTVLIFLIVSVQNPFASLMGEPRSEGVYEFWYKAKTMGLRGSMMSLMSGEALAWLERILMWFVVKVIPVKYVFVVAQSIELAFIAGVVSMPCLKTFSRFFTLEVRLLACIFMGCWMFFQNAYYFWGVSYWATFFFIAFAFIDMSKLRWWAFWSAVLFTVVLCVSRVYNVVLIPIAIFLIIMQGKERGFRFRIYCTSIALASTFEILYSMINGAGNHISELQQAMNIPLFIINTLYYQIQVINSFLTGAVHQMGLFTNVVYLIMLLVVIWFFMCLLVNKNKSESSKSLATILGCLGILSFGTIALNVITAASTSSVGFPHDYGAIVNWSTTFYQEADYHFSYAYISLVWIIMTLLYYFQSKYCHYISLKDSDKKSEQRKVVYTRIICVCFIFLSVINGKTRKPISDFYVEWQKVAYTTERNSYYLAVNVSYGVANINMRYNSDGFIYGVTSDGTGYIWRPGEPAYDRDYKYHEAVIGDISSIKEQPLIDITVRKALINFDVTYVAVLWDQYGNELARLPQVNSPERIWLDFIPDQPIYNVYAVTFELDDGNPAFVQDGMQIGYSTL